MSRNSEDVFAPLLKLDHVVPFEMVRECPWCELNTMCVNFAGDFCLMCMNPFCPKFQEKQFLHCYLKHRNYEVKQTIITTQEYMAVRPSGEWDFLHDVHKPTMNYGPHEDCTGILSWDKTNPSTTRDTWVVCNACGALYHVFAFMIRDIDMVTAKISPRMISCHEQFRLRKRSEFECEILTNWRPGERGLFRVRSDVALIVSEVRYKGYRVVQTEEFFAR